MIKNLIFDFGGVIAPISREQAVEAFRQLGVADAAAQLWSYCEHKFLWAHTGANPCNISNNFYFPVSSCMPCPFQPAFATVSLLACIIAYYSPRCREKGPFLGNFQPYRHPCPPHHCDA